MWHLLTYDICLNMPYVYLHMMYAYVSYAKHAWCKYYVFFINASNRKVSWQKTSITKSPRWYLNVAGHATAGVLAVTGWYRTAWRPTCSYSAPLGWGGVSGPLMIYQREHLSASECIVFLHLLFFFWGGRLCQTHSSTGRSTKRN